MASRAKLQALAVIAAACASLGAAPPANAAQAPDVDVSAGSFRLSTGTSTDWHQVDSVQPGMEYGTYLSFFASRDTSLPVTVELDLPEGFTMVSTRGNQLCRILSEGRKLICEFPESDLYNGYEGVWNGDLRVDASACPGTVGTVHYRVMSDQDSTPANNEKEFTFPVV